MGEAKLSEGEERRLRLNGEGALVWLAFVAIAFIAVALVAATAIRHGLRETPAAATAPGLDNGRNAPAPQPLPKPGIAPANGAALQGRI